MSHILDNENILHIQKEGIWPLRFESKAELLTRYSKRGLAANINIDPEMLPLSENSD